MIRNSKNHEPFRWHSIISKCLWVWSDLKRESWRPSIDLLIWEWGMPRWPPPWIVAVVEWIFIHLIFLHSHYRCQVYSRHNRLMMCNVLVNIKPNTILSTLQTNVMAFLLCKTTWETSISALLHYVCCQVVLLFFSPHNRPLLTYDCVSSYSLPDGFLWKFQV